MLEHDEGVRAFVDDPRDTHDRRPLDGRHAARFREKTLTGGIVAAVAQDLERYDRLCRLVEGMPDVGHIVAALRHREAVAPREDLPDLPVAGRGRHRFGAFHATGLTLQPRFLN